jgi:ABC-type amino acid transport substrate-binding protein
MSRPGGTLRAGVFDHTPRMSFIDAHGKRTGLCVELVAMIADRIATSIGLEILDRIDSAMNALRNGDIDFVAIELTPQDPAPPGVRYTDPFCFIDVVAYARSDVPAVHWKDLNRPDITLMVGESTSYVGFAPQYLPLAKLIVFGRSGLETAGAIARGDAHAGLKDAQLALQYPRMHPNLRILDGALAHVAVSFVVRAGDGDLLGTLNRTFAELRGEQAYQARLDYWLRGWAWEADHRDPSILPASID